MDKKCVNLEKDLARKNANVVSLKELSQNSYEFIIDTDEPYNWAYHITMNALLGGGASIHIEKKSRGYGYRVTFDRVNEEEVVF
jgi:hypothetical protein